MASNKRPGPTRFSVRNLPKVRDETFVSIYCNATNFLASLHDIQILMGHVEMGPETAILREQGVVIMSPSHFKAFALAVNRQVEEWEAQHGEIALPKQK